MTVAAQACLLLLHRRTDYFPRLRSILVYPTSFVAKTVKQEGPGMIAEGPEARLGETWLRGPLVLSWDDVLADAAGSRTGSNVVLHEFAHELDDEDGEANGAPALERGQSYADWARVLGAAYERLRRDAERGHESVLDDYGAQNPAEFFAVATEAFFEMPVDLQIQQPDSTRNWKSSIGRIRRGGKRRGTIDGRRWRMSPGPEPSRSRGWRSSMVYRPSSIVTSRLFLSAAWRAR